MVPIVRFKLYDRIQLKKPHPCGGSVFQILRVGSEVRIVCQTCGRDMTINRIKLEKVMDESIMSEFMALKPAIIELIVRQYKQEKVENFDEAVARKFLNDEITLPVLCSETDRHAQEIIYSNKTYQNFIRQTVNAIRPQQP